ncbi:MAG: glycosyltransferase [Trueperaceae bacterium]|nr:MAG: glycosyltransferase [Trueperaceae bacterium]
MDKPDISVLTVTRNRPDILRLKGASLVDQTVSYARFEWIVCVNGPCAETEAFLRGQHYPFALHVIELDEAVSVSRARNACARRARGEYYYLSDDDCLLAERTLELHWQAQRVAPRLLVGGIRFIDGPEVVCWSPNRAHYWNVNGANTSLPAAIFQEVDGFDEWLVDYGGEDLLLGYKVFARGLEIDALQGAMVDHVGANPMRATDLAKARSAGGNAVLIARRYPRLAFRLGVHPQLLALKRALFRTPFGTLMKGFAPQRYAYERAYLEGAEDRLRGI